MRVAEVVSCSGGGRGCAWPRFPAQGGRGDCMWLRRCEGRQEGRPVSIQSSDVVHHVGHCAVVLPPGPYRHHQQRRVAVLVAVLVNAILVASMWQRCVAALAVLPRQSCFDLQRSRLAWSSVLVSVSKAELGLEAVVLAHLVHETALRVGGRCGDSQCMVREPCTAMHLSCESRGNRHVFKTVDGLR